MKVWVQLIGKEDAFQVKHEDGMDIDELKIAIARERDIRHFPAGAVLSVHSKNDYEEATKFKPSSKVSAPVHGNIGFSDTEPYFFTIAQIQSGTVDLSFGFHVLLCCCSGQWDAPKVLPLRGFTKAVTECSNFRPSAGSCPREKLVDFFPGIAEAVAIVVDCADQESNDSGGNRVMPLVNARLPGGGKTTFLMYLFDELRANGYAPVLISFNAPFVIMPHETQLQALVRALCTAMTDVEPADSHRFSFPDEDALLEHITTTAGGCPVVLLIDELNILSGGMPLDAKASQFLKRYFLDKKGHYLVFTSHIPYTLDGAHIPANPWGYLTVHQPQSTDVSVLRVMSDDCEAITPAQIAIYGGIPSLLFTLMSGRAISPSTQLRDQGISVEPAHEFHVLQKFISEVLTGRTNHRQLEVRQFDIFSSVDPGGFACWPLCYISCILRLFPSVLTEKAVPFKKLMDDHLIFFAGKTETGLDWDLIVQSALILRSIAAKVNGTSGPFDIAEVNVNPDVLCITMPDECIHAGQCEGLHHGQYVFSEETHNCDCNSRICQVSRL